MAAWRLAALVVRLPGKFIPRGTGLLIAGLLASIAGMIFDRVAKVDVMMNARTGQHNRLNIYFPVRAASTPCCCESRRHRGTRQQACPAPSVADKLHVHVVHCVRDRCPAGDEELSRAWQAHHRLRAVRFVVSAHRSRPAHLCELKKRQGGKRRRTAFAAGPIRVNALHRRLMRKNGWARPSLRLGGTPSVSRRFISDSSFEWEEPRSRVRVRGFGRERIERGQGDECRVSDVDPVHPWAVPDPDAWIRRTPRSAWDGEIAMVKGGQADNLSIIHFRFPCGIPPTATP